MAQDDTDQTTGKAPAEKASARRASTKKTTAKATATKTTAKKSPTKKAPAPRAPGDAEHTPRPARRSAAATAEAPRRPGAGAIAREAAAQLYELTGHEIEGITAIHRDDDGWVVEIDVLELRRIPATTDVLATYEIQVDDEGDLTGYQRRHRFVRGSVGEGR